MQRKIFQRTLLIKYPQLLSLTNEINLHLNETDLFEKYKLLIFRGIVLL